MTTVILKPTDGCNARCRYCSAAHGGASKMMSPETLRRVLDLFRDWSLLGGGEPLRIIWHGGEPLLMPEEFWDEVLAAEEEILRSRGIAVENRIQTNGTRIGPRTIPALKRLLGETGVVGTSADPLPGVREIAGAPDGAYGERWEEAMGLLRAVGIRYGILHVVHRGSLPRLGEIYRLYRDRHPGAGLRFNPLYRQGRAGEAAVWGDLGITAEEWGRALIGLHRAWEADGRPPSVQPFGPWWRLHRGGRWSLSCECSGRCVRSHFGVDPEGNLFLCGRSADGGTLGFGNAADLTAAVLRDHPLRRALGNRIVYLERTACRDCRWWGWCHGGCINDALLEGGTPFAPTSLCAGLRMYFDEVFGGDGTGGEGGEGPDGGEDGDGGTAGQGAGCAA